MARKSPPPIARPVSAEDVDPRHRWDRPLQAPGHMQVDFEERVDFRRLHAYRPAQGRSTMTRLTNLAAGRRQLVWTLTLIASIVVTACKQGGGSGY